MTREQLQKELEALSVKRDQLIRDMGLNDGAMQTIAYFMKQLEVSEAPAEETEDE